MNIESQLILSWLSSYLGATALLVWGGGLDTGFGAGLEIGLDWAGAGL